MTNPVIVKIIKFFRGHPCEKIIKQTANEISISGASAGIGEYKIEIGKFENKVKKIHEVTNLMVTIDNSQYMLCTTVSTMELSPDLKELVNRIRIQTMLGFNQLQAIIGSLEQNVTDELLKKLEEWIEFMGELNKRSIETIGMSQKTTGFSEMKKSIDTESFKEKPDEPIIDFLDRMRSYQNVEKDDLDLAIKELSK